MESLVRQRPRARRPIRTAIACAALSLLGCSIEGKPADNAPRDASPVEEASHNDASVDASADADMDAAVDDGAADVVNENAPDASGSCAEATSTDLPEVGGALTIAIDLGSADADLIGTCGGSNRERVVRLEPSHDAALLITFSSGGAFTPVLYVRKGDCGSTAPADEVVCHTDGFTAQATISFKAGETVYAIADADGSLSSSVGTLTLLRLQ